MKNVYLDNAASTPLRDEVIDRMQKCLSTCYGNPSSTHGQGRTAKTQIEKARKTIAKYINAQATEIIFTSGGTEANNMILRSAVRDLGVRTIITTKVEHHAVLHTLLQLQKEYHITIKYVFLKACGTPDLEHLEVLLEAEDTPKLVSLMHINNEIGNITDITAVVHICKQYGALVHSDAVQSVGHWEWDVCHTEVDFLSASAHKFHGPKGVGFVYLRKNSGIHPLIFGGAQERGLRAGTEAFHNIAGMEEAMQLAYDNLEEERRYITELKQYFIETVRKAIPKATFNGRCTDPEKSTYTLVNVCFPFSEEKEQIILFHMDINGIACSKGSACQSGSISGSHVLKAILTTEALKQPSLRFSFSKYNTKTEIDYVAQVLKDFADS